MSKIKKCDGKSVTDRTRQTDRQIDGRKDGRTYGWTDSQTDNGEVIP